MENASKKDHVIRIKVNVYVGVSVLYIHDYVHLTTPNAPHNHLFRYHNAYTRIGNRAKTQGHQSLAAASLTPAFNSTLPLVSSSVTSLNF